MQTLREFFQFCGHPAAFLFDRKTSEAQFQTAYPRMERDLWHIVEDLGYPFPLDLDCQRGRLDLWIIVSPYDGISAKKSSIKA